MNKARLEWHRENQRSRSDYFRQRNASAMADWAEVWANIDRSDPAVLDLHAEAVSLRATRLLNAGLVLEGERREGALKRAGRFVREARALETRAAALRRGEKPLDEWALCRCSQAFQPGPRGYTQCYNCSSKEWLASSWSCIYCERRHSMSYPLCFVCKQEQSEDEARFIRLMIQQRDNYCCQMCGVDAMETGAELQVDRINPDAGNWAWNMQTLCGPCDALKGKSYDKFDERAYWALVRIYTTSLWDYLSSEERAQLLTLTPDTDHEQIDFAAPRQWQFATQADFCSDEDGLLNVLASFDAKVVSPWER